MPFSDAVMVNPPVRLKRGETYPFVAMADIEPTRRSVDSPQEREFRGSGARFKNGDTLMARITPCLENGKIGRYHSPRASSLAHGSTEFIVIRGRSGVTDNEFAYYLTQSNGVRDYAISQMSGTSGRQRVPTQSLDHLYVRVPSLAQQYAIARILGRLDDKIELNRRMNETLEAIVLALFKSWLVDFDPVRAKMECRDSKIPKHIADLFPDRLVDSEMGEIPEGWEVRPLMDLIEVNPSRPLKKGQDAPYLNMANMPTRGHTPAVVDSRLFGSGMRFMNGDTLVARITPCLENGKTAYVDFLEDGQIGWGSTEYIVMRPKPPLPNEFAYFLARSRRFREYAIQNMSGTSGRQRVQAKALWLFPIVNPSKKVAEAFGTLIHSFIVRASMAGGESRSLASLRDSLLAKLITGEIRLRKTENQEVEACTG